MAKEAMGQEVSECLVRMGFPEAFAGLVGAQLNTPFTGRMMLGYLRDAQPRTMEEVADEMLGILELRDKCMKKQIEKRGH